MLRLIRCIDTLSLKHIALDFVIEGNALSAGKGAQRGQKDKNGSRSSLHPENGSSSHKLQTLKNAVEQKKYVNSRPRPKSRVDFRNCNSNTLLLRKC